jgi:iron complex outermembrane receptor protein
MRFTHSMRCAVSALALLPSAAFAQSAPAGNLAEEIHDDNEITVTAQRRAESAQNVPISLTVLSSTAIAKASITNVQDLGRLTPGFTTFRATQPANTFLAIRGVGSSGNAAIEPSVGAFVDGIYIARPGPLLAAINDVSSVEVLRGPQGTLFGRNASVGAISFTTTAPKPDQEGMFSAEYGSFNRFAVNGMINLPVNDRVATRFSVLYNENDGYGRDILNDDQRFGGTWTFSMRGAVRAELTDSLTWTLRGDWQRQGGNAQAVTTVDAKTVTAAGATNIANLLDGKHPILNDTYSNRVRQITGGSLRDRQYGFASDLALDVGDFTLRLLSGYRNWNSRQVEGDTPATAADLFGRDTRFRSKTHSQELQIISPTDLFDGRLRFVGGAYYFREDYEIDTLFHTGSGWCNFVDKITAGALAAYDYAACMTYPTRNAAVGKFGQKTESWAGYGQATVNITDAWDVTGGLRYSHDAKDGFVDAVKANPTIVTGLAGVDYIPSMKFDGGKMTYRLNTTFRPTRGVMLFATMSTGFKSGGFDSSTGSAVAVADRIFRPELTTNYEVGVKSDLFDRMLTFNATLFRMDVDDFQIRSYDGSKFTIRNAGSRRSDGVELDVTARPVEGLILNAAATYLKSKYTSFQGAPGLPAFGGVQDLTGTRPNFSPKWQGNASFDYRTNVTSGWDINLVGRVNFTSDVNVGGGGDGNPQGLEPGYALLGGRIAMISADDKWEVALSGENLTNHGYCTLRFNQTLNGLLGVNDPLTGGTMQRCVLAEPRSVKVSAKVRF